MIDFIRRWEKLVGKDAVNKITKLKLKPCIRLNTLKIDDKIISRLTKEKAALTKIPYLKDGYYFNASFKPSSMTENLLGYFYIQEAASQLPVQILDPTEKDLVLDMAAAPGSKTTQISQLMNNKGILVAVDINMRRLEALKNNCERLGISNVISYKLDGREAETLGKKFDKILLDAPCMGNCVVDEKWFNNKTIYDIKDRVSLQKELLNGAMKVSKKGTIIVYSTCSIEPEENELMIDWLIRKHKVKLHKVKTIGEPALTDVFGKKLNEEVKNCERIWPHKTNTQAFFIAKIEVL